jgi:hypothetical protein
MRHGDRGPLIQWSATEESLATITTRSVLPRAGSIQSQQAALAKGRAMRFLAKSHRVNAIVPTRSGISPAAVAGWAVARFIADVGKWRKAESSFEGKYLLRMNGAGTATFFSRRRNAFASSVTNKHSSILQILLRFNPRRRGFVLQLIHKAGRKLKNCATKGVTPCPESLILE